MAILKNLIVNGVTRVIGDLTAAKIIKQGGVSSLFLKADGSVDGNAYIVLTSTARPGVTKLYRRDGDSGYNVLTVFDGTYWVLLGYASDTYHAPCRVGYADNADTLDNKHASDFATAEHTHSYLPLSGGTITGTVSFNAKDPLAFYAYGSGIYTQSGIFIKNGTFTLELPRETNSATANIIPLHIKARGGQWAPIYAGGFYKGGSSDNYVLLGGGGHKVLSDFLSNPSNGSSSYFLRGDKVWSNNLYNTLNLYPSGGNYADGIRIHSRDANNDWCSITFCASDNNGSVGQTANSWYLGVCYGDFYIGKGGTGRGSEHHLRSVNQAWECSGTWNLLSNITSNGVITANGSAMYINGDNSTLYINNTTTNTDAYSIIKFGVHNKDNLASIFLNGPNRTFDGGNNTMTIRNNVGNLRLNNDTNITGAATLDSTCTIAEKLTANKEVYFPLHLAIGANMSTYQNDRAELDLLTVGNEACDLWLGTNSTREWVLTARPGGDIFLNQYLLGVSSNFPIYISKYGNFGIGSYDNSYRFNVDGGSKMRTLYVGDLSSTTAYTGLITLYHNGYPSLTYNTSTAYNGESSWGIQFDRGWNSYNSQKAAGIYAYGTGDWGTGLIFRVYGGGYYNLGHDRTALDLLADGTVKAPYGFIGNVTGTATGNVADLSINGNYLRCTKNGSNYDLTIPYATTSTNSTIWNRTWHRDHDLLADTLASNIETRVYSYDSSTINTPSGGAGFVISHNWDWGNGTALLVQTFDDGDRGRLYTNVKPCETSTWQGWRKVAYVNEIPTSLPANGGTATNVSGGRVSTSSNCYKIYSDYGINMNNSDIIGANCIYFGDLCEDAAEGIHFYRDSSTAGNYDTIWALNGVLYFTPNHAAGSSGTNYIIYHSGNIPSTSSYVTVNSNNTNQNYKLLFHSSNTIYSSSGSVSVTVNPYTGNISAGHFYANSDIRYKNITDLYYSLSSKIALLPIFKYTWINREDHNLHIGSSALSVMSIIPELVSYDDNTDFYSLDYATLGAVAGISACKEVEMLKLKVKELELEIIILKSKYNG